MNVNKKNIFLSIAVIFIGLLVIGGTFAALSISNSINVTNGVYQHTIECFDIEYDGGDQIIGMMIPSSTSAGGLSGSLSVGINNSCDVTGLGDLDLIVESNSNKTSVLTQIVDPHCENSSTLQTLTDYTDESSCISGGGVWVTEGTALKYAVYVGSNTVPSSVGYIDKVGDTVGVYNGFTVTTLQEYTLTVWLDGNLSDNTYANISFSGKLDTTVTQIED